VRSGTNTFVILVITVRWLVSEIWTSIAGMVALAADHDACSLGASSRSFDDATDPVNHKGKRASCVLSSGKLILRTTREYNDRSNDAPDPARGWFPPVSPPGDEVSEVMGYVLGYEWH
jgi:hypothetical protein